MRVDRNNTNKLFYRICFFVSYITIFNHSIDNMILSFLAKSGLTEGEYTDGALGTPASIVLSSKFKSFGALL